MPQFSITPSRAAFLEKIPDYAVKISPAVGNVTVTVRDQVVAKSGKALVIEETDHAPVFYLPRDDVQMALFERTDHSTYCPFKGHASYWSLKLNDAVEGNLVWSYEDPDPEVAGLKNYLSFYTDRAVVEFEGG
jgi:uncharacterized protein (DUF427 family)